MNRAKMTLIVVVGALMLGSLAATGGWAWYLRSPAYRAHCEAVLTEAIGLPGEIGAVVPRSRRSREFDRVVVWLPERRGRALTCERSLVIATPTPDSPDAYKITLRGGTCEISSRTWLHSDYRGVFASGLKPGFSPDGPREVDFGDMDVVFDRDGFRVAFRHAGGVVDFSDPQHARASIVCRQLNDYTTPYPVHLTADIFPTTTGIRVDPLSFDVPEVPLDALRLGGLVGTDVCSGRFSGRLTYSEHDDRTMLTVAGRCTGLDLAELTTGLLPVAWRGRCPRLALEELRLEDGRPVRLRFSGRLDAIHLGDVLANFGLPLVNGTVTLDIGAAEIDADHIARLVASGEARDVSLEQATGVLGDGRMTGNLQVRIRDLTVVDDRLASFDAVLKVDEATERPNWIEGALLEELVWRILKVDLPPILPQRIEYTRLGLRLEVRDEQLFVYGEYGDRGETILTAKLFGNDVPLVHEPKRSFDLTPMLDRVRERLRRKLHKSRRWSDTQPSGGG